MSYLEDLFEVKYERREDFSHRHGMHRMHCGTSQEKKKDEQEEPKVDQINISALENLNEVLGPDQTLSLLLNYKVQDVLHGENLLERCNFLRTPTEGPQRVYQATKAFELDSFYKDNFDGNGFTNNANKISLDLVSYENLLTNIVEIHSGVDEDDRKSKQNWFLQSFTSFLDKTLQRYGEDVSNEDKELLTNEDVFIEIKNEHGVKALDKTYILPGENSNNVLETFRKQFERRRDKRSIWTSIRNIYEPKFDSWEVELEFLAQCASTKIGNKNTASPKMYSALGLTSMEALKSVKSGAVQRVHDLFKDFAEEYVKGDLGRFNELLRNTQIKNAKQYFQVLNGDYETFKELIVEKGLRPNPDSVDYVKANFDEAKGKSMEEVFEIAERINLDNFENISMIDTSSVEELNQLSEEYAIIKDKYISGMKGEDHIYFSNTHFEILKEYEGDMRFFKYFNIWGTRDEDNTKSVGIANNIQQWYSFDQFIGLLKNIHQTEPITRQDKFEIKWHGELISNMINLGYEKNECEELMKEGRNVSRLNKIFENLSEVNNKLDLNIVRSLEKSYFSMEKACDYLQRDLIGENKIPFSAVSILGKHDYIETDDLVSFDDTVGIGRYWKDNEQEKISFEEGVQTVDMDHINEPQGTRYFDAVGFINDFRIFTNYEPGKKKKK